MTEDDFGDDSKGGANEEVTLLELKEIAHLAGKHERTVQRWLRWPGFPRPRRTRRGHNGYPRKEFLEFLVQNGKRLRCAKHRST